MAKFIKEAEIITALKGLGKNYREIRKNLASKKITGVPGDSDCCPIANYLKCKFKSASYIRVGVDTISVEKNDHTVTVASPGPVQTFINHFDEEEYAELIKE